VVQDLYEPGSTFKIVTASAALEEGVVEPSDRIDVSAGLIRFGSRVINDDRRNGVLSFEDVIVKSSNVGAIKVGLRLGPERLSAYVRQFGFGRSLSPDFRGENPGIVWDASKLNDSALASVSMGYQVGVTPLQMAAAVSVVANGGSLIEPRVVRAVVRDGERVQVPHKVLGRVISANTAAELTGIMEAVVDRGTAQRAQVPGFTVAGKTGTASKVVDGRYSRSDYNVSFAGFVPSRKPMFTITVVIDTPRATAAYGGVVAAPIFQRIADAALRHYGVPPTVNPPPAILADRNNEVRELPATTVAGSRNVIVDAVSTRNATVVPDLTGLGARDALRALAALGIEAELRGNGVVVAQDPEPGSPVRRGVSGALWLARQMPTPEPEDDRP
jgi:cell division protein FtsI/penicillin-binding protein 2